MNNERSSRGSQTERVFARRSEILELLDRRVRIQSIKDDLGFGDMPRSTFNRLVGMIREEDRNKPTSVNAALVQGEPVIAPSEPTQDTQPEREDVKSPDEKPQKPAKRKRRRKGVITPNLDAKDQNLDPSKWSSEL